MLFAIRKGSLEALTDRDPEEARKLLDPAVECIMEAVHRYEGTVNQVMGHDIMALFGAPPWRTKTMPCAPATPHWPCSRRFDGTPSRSGESTGSRSRFAWASIPVR